MTGQVNPSDYPTDQDEFDGGDDLVLGGVDLRQPLDMGPSLDSDEPAFSPVSDQSPASAAAVLGRIDEAVELVDQEAQVTAGPSEDEGDDDIRQYMASLLARSNGYSGNPTAAQTVPTQPAESDASEETAKVEVKPAKPRQPKQAPEARGDLSNMRELANMNARSALKTHSHQQTVRRMWSNLGVAVTSMTVSIVLLQYFPSQGLSMFFYLALALFLVAGIWTWKFISLGSALKTQARAGGSKPGNPDADSSGPGADNAPPPTAAAV